MYYQNDHYGPIDKFCARHPNFGVHNLMLWVGIGQVIVFVLELLFPNVAHFIPLYAPLVLRGQIWRLVTFIFEPNSSNPFYLLLGCYFYFWIGQTLEREWGTAKFTLFYLCGVALTAVYGLIAGLLSPLGAVYPLANVYYVNLSIFLIVATYYGEMRVLLFFVIPIKMKWMALIDVVLILIDAIRYLQMGTIALPLALAFLPSIVNYFLFTWPVWAYRLGGVKRRADPKVVNFKRAQRQAQQNADAVNTGRGYTRKCAVCGITDADDPNMEFRYCSKCEGEYCYCIRHIYNHAHIRRS